VGFNAAFKGLKTSGMLNCFFRVTVPPVLYDHSAFYISGQAV